MNARADQLRGRILQLIAEYHDAAFAPQPFVPGQTPVRVAGRVFGAEEMQALAETALDFWLTTGRFAEQFEAEFARYLGVDAALLVNSGSSANLAAVASLTSPKLGPRRLMPGDEIITIAAGFPTTVNPILQNGLVPVFVDVEIPGYNIDADRLEEARSERTRAVMIAHTLGNPFDLDRVTAFTRKYGLWLIEDSCDALGSEYRDRKTGSFGDLATFSFYPAHHITMGEGGCVVTDNPELKHLVASFRDWGRDCWCDPGKDNTCGRRFEWQLGGLPFGFDHKYTFSHVGYNLKATDMQAAVGLAQLERLPEFVARRKHNFRILHAGLAGMQDFFILPQASGHADPSWFGFPILLRREAPFRRIDVIRHLEGRKIATRLLFGGNLVRQPAYRDVPHRIAGSLDNADLVMERLFWLGVYPGITDEMLEYVLDTLRKLPDTMAGSARHGRMFNGTE